MDIRESLFALCDLSGPSGFEQTAAKKAVELLSPLMDEAYIDRFGNAVGVRRSKRSGAKKILWDAHLDEIGLMVTGMEDGYLRFRTIGGVDPRMLPDRELTVLCEAPLLGVVTCLPPHLQTSQDQDKSVPLGDLFVDVGMSQEQAEKSIPVGTPMVFRGGCFSLGPDQVCGKSLDDRSCFVTLLRAAELLRGRDLDVDLYLIGSTREEVSGAGAKTASFCLAPDCCVAVDVTHGKTPDVQNPRDRSLELFEGPAIGVGPNMTRWMTERMVEKAKAEKIPYQLEVMEGNTGTNGWGMQIAREGIATSVLSLPLKYMHSPIEVVAVEDMEHVARLLAAFTEKLGKEGAFGV
ncbi:putative aminopeptidase YsdC [bioreactor metagenome]|uniref:Putative aminopeptidase YsdC n=1 Tax=bioreactor metagenome TaxID=1076179 RepID=A0A644XV14_9ZZZZ